MPKSFVICHVLRARKQSSLQEPNESVGLSADIADMRIPLPIISDSYTYVFHAFKIRFTNY